MAKIIKTKSQKFLFKKAIAFLLSLALVIGAVPGVRIAWASGLNLFENPSFEELGSNSLPSAWKLGSKGLKGSLDWEPILESSAAEHHGDGEKSLHYKWGYGHYPSASIQQSISIGTPMSFLQLSFWLKGGTLWGTTYGMYERKGIVIECSYTDKDSGQNVSTVVDQGKRITVNSWEEFSYRIELPEDIGAKSSDGKVTITAKFDANQGDIYIDDATLSVYEPPVLDPVESIAFTGPSWVLEQGETAQIPVIILPQTAANKALEWESQDTSIVSVDSGGNVTGIAALSNPVILTAKTKDGSNLSASVKVYVDEPSLNLLKNSSLENWGLLGKPENWNDVRGTAITRDAGVDKDSSLHIQGTSTTVLAYQNFAIPKSLSGLKISFWAKGTPGQSFILRAQYSRQGEGDLIIDVPGSFALTDTWTQYAGTIVLPEGYYEEAVSFKAGLFVGWAGSVDIWIDDAAVEPVINQKVQSITFGRDQYVLELGDEASVPLPEILPAEAETALSWTIADETIATVDGNGKVKALKTGDTVIRASADGAVGEANLYVVDPAANLISNNPGFELGPVDSGTGSLGSQPNWALSSSNDDKKGTVYTVADTFHSGEKSVKIEFGNSLWPNNYALAKTALVPSMQKLEASIWIKGNSQMVGKQINIRAQYQDRADSQQTSMDSVVTIEQEDWKEYKAVFDIS
ncbi:MAG: Ig-like domain-containing protein, partial [Clostridiales bacterium]|nr:Ig-like domain-containing protein [Clostridiales bacterium]